jgi:hypothetical protein
MNKLVALFLLGLALQVAALTVSKSRKHAITHRAKKGDIEFDWNKETALSGIKPMIGGDMPAPRTTWKGWLKNTYPGGHNFATRRALDYVIGKARADTKLATVVTKYLHGSLDALYKDQDTQPTAAKMLVFGNFQNELRVNIDGEGSVAVSLGATLIRQAFGKDKEVTLDGSHSEWWNRNTGYSSANPIHAMLVSSTDKKENVNKYTQAYSYNTMVAFARRMAEQAITLLRKEKSATTDTDNWKKGLRSIGSILHTIQDSACACTPKHMKVKSVEGCIEGDGHGVLAFFPTENRWKVTGLSDSIFYDQRHDFHAALDSLYDPEHTLPTDTLVKATSRKAINDEYNKNANYLWGDNDPAYDGGNLILEVIKAIDTTENAGLAAQRLVKSYLEDRFVAASSLKMPTIQESMAKKKKF